MVYKLKVYKLPLATPQARGKAMINLLPLQPGETITTLMPLPEDEDTWGSLFAVFATATGNVRRNALSDFTNVMANGKIAMKLDEGDRLVRVRTFAEDDDILLFTRGGQCIRFPVPDVRVFSGRTSTGVRGVRLTKGDEVISMCGLRHVKADPARREEYLQSVNAKRRLMGSDYSERPDDRARDEALTTRLDQTEFQEMVANEEYLLTVSEDGFGKRSSSYEYRISGRGGQGVGAIDLTRTRGSSQVVAAFPLLPSDQIVMITDGGQLIRCTVDTVSIMSRKTRGVRLFNTAEGERVVSVTRIREVDDGSALGDAAETDIDEGEQSDADAQTADRSKSSDEEGP
jgi:DNA gyrase subunit A